MRAERQLAEGDLAAARATARRLLAAEPLEGRGFRVLAAVARKSGDDAQALALYGIAAKRSPRDLAARAWLAEHYLARGQYRAGLAQIDAILRKAPYRERFLLPRMARLASDPEFASELAELLARRPLWRASLLSTLEKENPGAADVVISGLAQHGGLTVAETDEWLNRLMRQGRWAEAYGQWTAMLPAGQPALAAVYNGDFAALPSSRGFDWRKNRLPGVDLSFVPDAAPRGSGFTAHATFRDRPVAALNLEQPLLLRPGNYRLSVRMRAHTLDSEQGLEWWVACDGAPGPIGSSSGIGGTFAWRIVEADVRIPPTGCGGQWLRLQNPAPGGAAQKVKGELWFDDVSIVSVDPVGPAIATLRIGRGQVMAGAPSGFQHVRNGEELASGQRLLLFDGAFASVQYRDHCTKRYRGPAVAVIDDRCLPVGAGGSPSRPVTVDRVAAATGIEAAILGGMEDRSSPPAGR